jgi:hypothetical protein
LTYVRTYSYNLTESALIKQNLLLFGICLSSEVFRILLYPGAYKKDKGSPLSFIILLGLSFLLASCGTFQFPKYPTQLSPTRCLPDFPDQDGWYGADGAYSIALDEERTLWLFGDTFAEDDAGRKDRVGMDIIMGNTLAISTCAKNATFKIHYYLKKKGGKFVSSLGCHEIIWPQDPFIAGGALYIPLLVVRSRPEVQSPFNFKIGGQKFARIKDFRAEDPRAWPVDYLDWTAALPRGIEALATTSVVYGGHVYFYALYRNTKDNVHISGNILMRISIGNLDDPANKFEYLNSEGSWRANLQPEEVKIIFAAGVSELSVRYHADEGRWIAVYLSPEGRGRQLLHQTAQNLEGPWSPPSALIHAIPEVDPASPLYDQDTFCYAGKEHRQFERNGNIVVTYVCNSAADINNQKSFLRRNLFLYRPIVKSIRQ